MTKVTLLGVSINAETQTEVQETVKSFFQSPGCKLIVTVNPEFLVLAHGDKKFRDILNSADLATADGAGIIYLARLRGFPVTFSQRITGVDLTCYLVELCQRLGMKIVIVQPDDALSSPEQVSQALLRDYPGLNLQVYSLTQANALQQPFEAEVVFVTLGAPFQETWISDHRSLLASVKIAIGVGGTFDFISGKISRAPMWMRSLGLEWLWRLIIKPARIGRIIRAVVIFPWLVITDQYGKKQ